MTKFKLWTYISALLATIVGGLILSIAFQHNPQGEFINNETGAIEIAYSAKLFVAWFLPVFFLLELPALLILLVKRFAKS